MKLGAVLSFLALTALTSSVPAFAAKDEKLPRCNGRQKRPANPYGTVLPTMPPRDAQAAAGTPPLQGVPRGTPAPGGASPPTTNLFPSDSATAPSQGSDTSQEDRVPPIGALGPNGGPTAALSTSYASC